MKKNTHKSDCVELHAGFSSSHKFFSLVKSLNQQTSFKSGILFFRMYNSCKFLQHWMSAKVVMQFTLKMDKKKDKCKKILKLFSWKRLGDNFSPPTCKITFSARGNKKSGRYQIKTFLWLFLIAALRLFLTIRDHNEFSIVNKCGFVPLSHKIIVLLASKNFTVSFPISVQKKCQNYELLQMTSTLFVEYLYTHLIKAPFKKS